jgi:hypothetical protein
MSSNNPHQQIIDELTAAGVKVHNLSPYKLLWQLCVYKGVYMNGSGANAGRNGGIKRQTVTLQARNVLAAYMATGELKLPAHFQMKRPAQQPIKAASKTTLDKQNEISLRRQTVVAKILDDKAKKMAAIEAYAKEHNCTITQAMIALM